MGLFSSRQPRTTLFYASDIHGSEKCFLKFVNAAKFYSADVLILGGDLTGKVMVPLVRTGSGRYRAQFQGAEVVAESEAERAELEKRIRFNGFYPVVLEPDEFTMVANDSALRDELFEKVVSESIRRWVDIADERLLDQNVRCIAYPGNDDEPYVDAILASSEMIENADG